jgi:uncharacterized protein (DUF58 family)
LIYPTRLAIAAAAAGAPLALLVGVVQPTAWYAGLAWPVTVLLLSAIDALSGAAPRHARIEAMVPATMGIGDTLTVMFDIHVDGRRPPRQAEAAAALDPLLSGEDRVSVALTNGHGSANLLLTATRRGAARLDHLWIRWRGRLGLVWKQREFAVGKTLNILPDMRPVHEKGAKIFDRNTLPGLIVQHRRGDGTDFDSLVDYQPGMDRRAIDWRQSARHMKLHAREYTTEQNTQIVFAVDAGRQMCEPVGGLPRVDRVVSAVLLAAWVALKLGDRVALFSFDARPRLSSGAVSGSRAFPLIQRLAAQIDYSGAETNHTLGLTTLATTLDRRSMIVLFTELTDLTGAQLMVRAMARLVEKHVLLLVVLEDEELEAIVEAPPEQADDVTRAVTAAELLRERRIVLTHVRHLGVHVIETPHDKVPERLVSAYFDLKRRNLL